MTKVQTVNILAGQMNLDKDPRLIDPQKEYTYANNFRNNNSADGSEGSGGNIKGNSEIVFSQPGGVNTVIGEVAYERENATIFFVYNSIGQHQIRMLKNNVIYALLTADFLNFHPDYPIEAVITNKDLIWCDGRNDNRIVNLERLWNYYNYINPVQIQEEVNKEINPVIIDSYEFDLTTPTGYYWQITFNPDGKAYLNYYDGVTPSVPPIDLGVILPTYREITNDTLKFIAQPPLTQLEPEYRTVESIIVNNLIGNQYKFTYRYVYLDNRKSVWAVHSLLPQPLYNEDEGGIIKDRNANNAIYLQFQFNRRDIKRIEFGVVKNDGVDVMVFDKLDIYNENGLVNNSDDKFSEIWFDGGYIGYTYFQDDTTYPIEAATDFNRLQDYVPLTSKHIELIGDRVLFSNNEHGINLPVPDVTVELNEIPVYPDTDSESGTVTISSGYTYDPISWLFHPTTFKNLDISGDIRGGTLSFHLKVVVDSITILDKDYDMYHNPNESEEEFIYRVFSSIDAEIQREATSEGYGNYESLLNEYTEDNHSGNIYYSGKYLVPLRQTTLVRFVNSGHLRKITNSGIPNFVDVSVVFSAYTYTKSTKCLGITTLKSNAKYTLGIKYMDDAQRESGVLKVGYVDVPQIGDSASWNPDYLKRTAVCTINHLPPEKATSYVFCISKDNKISEYQEVLLLSAPGAIGSNKLELDITTPITDLVEDNNNNILGAWVFEKGDRVRDIGLSDVPNVYGSTFDVEILSQDGTSKKITIPKPSTIDAGFTDPVKYTLLEVYRPKKAVSENDNVYYEISRRYPIVDGFHIGNTQDQTDSQPSKTELDFGDTYLVARAFLEAGSFITPIICESEDISDYFTSNMKPYGRYGVIIEDMKNKVYNNMIRFGGLKNQGTEFNQIAKFDGDNYAFLSEQYGDIAGIKSSGRNLTVVQASKDTTFYVETAVIKQADGTNLYTVSDEILNNKNESVYDYGSINPESIIRVNNYIYYFDAINGQFIRNADNGSFPVSDYGINLLAKLLGKAVINQGVKVYAGYDEYNKEVVWAWNWDSEDNVFGYGISFVENGNQWKSFQDFYLLAGATKKFVSLLSSNVNQLVSFVEGRTFLHDSNVLYNTLYGRTVTTEVEVVGNSELLQNKIFDYVTVESDHEWFAAERDNNGNIIATESFVDVDNGLMKSLIPSMRKKEENYVSEFGRDTLTKMVIPTLPSGITSEMYKYLNGRRLRGKFVKVKLRNNSTDKVKIFSVIINASISERL